MNQVDVSSDVRFWSDYVILSKRIAVDENYYEDEFIKYFSPKGVQDSILSIVSYARVVGIRTLIETFLSHFPDQTVQFVNLGAALDTTSLYLLSKYPNVVCFDLDLENEIRAKIDIITQTEELLSLFPNHKVDTLDFYSLRYHIFECDLRDLKNLEKLIDHGFSYDLPTVFLSEFVLTYLENHLSNEVIKHFCDNSKTFCLFIDLEYIRPNSSLFKWIYSILGQHTTMYSLSEYDSQESQNQRYKELGWDGLFSCDYNFIYNNFIDKFERKRLRSIENFKHMELLALYFSQPLIIVSYKHFDNELKNKFTRLFKENDNDIDEDDELLPYFTDEYLEKERNLDYLHDCFTRFCGDIFTQKL